MQSKKTVIRKICIVLFLFIIAIMIINSELLSNWTFSNPEYVKLSHGIFRLIFLASIAGFVMLRFKSYWIPISLFFLIIISISILLVYYPIDTIDEPIDKKILSINGDRKTIVRVIQNPKSFNKTLDTIVVEDYGILRKIIK